MKVELLNRTGESGIVRVDHHPDRHLAPYQGEVCDLVVEVHSKSMLYATFHGVTVCIHIHKYFHDFRDSIGVPKIIFTTSFAYQIQCEATCLYVDIVNLKILNTRSREIKAVVVENQGMYIVTTWYFWLFLILVVLVIAIVAVASYYVGKHN